MKQQQLAKQFNLLTLNWLNKKKQLREQGENLETFLQDNIAKRSFKFEDRRYVVSRIYWVDSMDLLSAYVQVVECDCSLFKKLFCVHKKYFELYKFLDYVSDRLISFEDC